MRRILALACGLAVAAAYFMLSALPALSADTGTVTAHVTVQGACITLDKTVLDFGPRPFSQPGELPSFAALDLTVTNCGPAAKIFGRGTNATNRLGSTWTLDDSLDQTCTVGVNRYKNFLNQSVANWGVLLSTVDKQLLGNAQLGSGSAATITTELMMPCTGSSGSGQRMSWQIVYTATL